jgi:TP901 family phage tail tape measure protein
MADQNIRVNYDVSDAIKAGQQLNAMLNAGGVTLRNVTELYKKYNVVLKQFEDALSGVDSEGRDVEVVLGKVNKKIAEQFDAIHKLNTALKEEQREVDKSVQAHQKRERFIQQSIASRKKHADAIAEENRRLDENKKKFETLINRQADDLRKQKERTESDRIKAGEALERQRSKALLAQFKADEAEKARLEKQRISAGESLDRQRSRALVQQQKLIEAQARESVGGSEISKALGSGALPQLSSRDTRIADPESLLRVDTALQRINQGFAKGKFNAADFGVALDAVANKSLVGLTKEQNLAAQSITRYNREVDNLKKGKQHVEEISISWQGLVRILEVQILHSAIARLINGLEQAATQARQFSIQVAEIQTISQTAQLSTTQWEQGILRLAEAFGKTPADVAAGAYDAISNQVTKGAETFQFLDQALKLSITTQATTANSVNLLSSVINAYNLEASKAAEISAVFFKAVDIGRFKVEDLANNFGHTAVLANSLGVSYQEVAASISLLTRNGISADEAQTQLSNLFIRMVKPTEEMKTLFEEWGVASAEAAVKTFGFFEVLRKFNQATGRGDRFQEIGRIFENIRAIRGFEGLSSDLNRLEDDFNQITTATGEFDNAVKIVADSTGKRMEKELQEINSVLLQFGDSLNKTALDGTQIFGGLSEAVSALLFNLKQFSEIVIFLAGAAGIGLLISKLAAFQATITAIETALLAHPIFALAAAIGIVALATESYTERNVRLTKEFAELDQQIDKTFEDRHRQNIRGLADDTKKLTEAINENLRSLLKFSAEQSSAASKLSKTIEADLEASDKNLEKLLNSVQGIYDEIVDGSKAAAKIAEESARKAGKEAEDATREIAKLQEQIGKRDRDFNNKVFDEDLQELASLDKIKKLKKEITDTEDKAQDFLDQERFEEGNVQLDRAVELINKLRDVQQAYNKEIEKEGDERKKAIEKAQDLLSGKSKIRTPNDIQDLKDAQKLLSSVANDTRIDTEVEKLKKNKERQTKARGNKFEDPFDPNIIRLNQQISQLEAQKSEETRKQLAAQKQIVNIKTLEKEFLDTRQKFDIAHLNALAEEKRIRDEQRNAALEEQKIQQQKQVDQAKNFEELKKAFKESDSFDKENKKSTDKVKEFNDLADRIRKLASTSGLDQGTQLEIEKELNQKSGLLERQESLRTAREQQAALQKEIEAKGTLLDISKAEAALGNKKKEQLDLTAQLIKQLERIKEFGSDDGFEDVLGAADILTAEEKKSIQDQVDFIKSVADSATPEKVAGLVGKLNQTIRDIFKGEIAAPDPNNRNPLLRLPDKPTGGIAKIPGLGFGRDRSPVARNFTEAVTPDDVQFGEETLGNILNTLNKTALAINKGQVGLQKQTEQYEKQKAAIEAASAELEKFKAQHPELSTSVDDALNPAKDKWDGLSQSIKNNIHDLREVADEYERIARASKEIQAPPLGGGGGAINPVAEAMGGIIPRYFAGGGFVGRGTDQIPAMLTAGESVINQKSTNAFSPLIKAINTTRTQNLSAGGDVTYVGDVNVSFPNANPSDISTREFFNRLKRDVRRKNFKF